jgi:hypothetical protein
MIEKNSASAAGKPIQRHFRARVVGPVVMELVSLRLKPKLSAMCRSIAQHGIVGMPPPLANTASAFVEMSVLSMRSINTAGR